MQEIAGVSLFPTLFLPLFANRRKTHKKSNRYEEMYVGLRINLPHRIL